MLFLSVHALLCGVFLTIFVMGSVKMFAIVFEKLNSEPAWQKILDKVKVSQIQPLVRYSLKAQYPTGLGAVTIKPEPPANGWALALAEDILRFIMACASMKLCAARMDFSCLTPPLPYLFRSCSLSCRVPWVRSTATLASLTPWQVRISRTYVRSNSIYSASWK